MTSNWGLVSIQDQKYSPSDFWQKKSRGLHVKKCTRKALRKLTDDRWFVSSKY
jgi:hypothetical protein